MNKAARDTLDFQERVGTGRFSMRGLLRFVADAGYRTAAPFSHLLLDDLFEVPASIRILQEWPAAGLPPIELHDDGKFVRSKSRTTWRTPLGAHTRARFEQLAHLSFMRLLQHLSDIQGLPPESHQFVGGLHGTAVGGRLAVHVDYNKHPVSRFDRPRNLLLYREPGWAQANGGELELRDHDASVFTKKVVPTVSKVVVFSTFAPSLHGQADRVFEGPDSFTSI